MEVLKNLKKIMNQALGREKMFGYKTTQANQFYLMYCILGNVFFTDKVHRMIKYAFFGCAYGFHPFIIATWLVTYVIYGVEPNETSLVIYVALVFLVYFLELCFVPMNTVVWNKTNIEEMIAISDRILLKKSTQEGNFKNKIDIKELTITVLRIYIISLSLYEIMLLSSVPVFYEEEKTKNYSNYVIPLFGMQHYASLKFYLFWTGYCITPGVTLCIIYIAQSLLAVLVAAVCHNEAHRIIEQLNSLSVDLDINIDTYRNVESKFREILQKSILDVNDLTRMISRFRDFFQPMCGVFMTFFLYIQIVHVLNLINPHYGFTVRMRESLALITSALQVYTTCWVGQTMQDLTEELSFAVYSTPWYWLKSVRKDVYIMLCQAQESNTPFALNVYPLTFPTFLRYCNTIHSSVNIIRATVRQE